MMGDMNRLPNGTISVGQAGSIARKKAEQEDAQKDHFCFGGYECQKCEDKKKQTKEIIAVGPETLAMKLALEG